MEISEYERGWLSAAIDGEGHVSLTKEKRPNYKAGYTFVPNIGVANISEEFILEVQRISGGGNYWMNRRGVFNYVMNPNTVYRVLPELRLIIKKEQADLLADAIEIIRHRTGKGHPRTEVEIDGLAHIQKQIVWLNRRGKGLEQAIKAKQGWNSQV